VHEKRVHGFLRTILLCGDNRAQMVEHEICLLTWALSYIGHVNNTSEDWSVVTVKGEQDLYGVDASR